MKKITVVLAEGSGRSGRSWWRRIRRRRLGGLAAARARFRRLESGSQLRLLREEEVDDGAHDGHGLQASLRRWLRFSLTTNGGRSRGRRGKLGEGSGRSG